MIDKWTDLSEFLNQKHIYSSTPTRLDCGGSTDHRLTGLLCGNWEPATANIAIDLRARVSLKPYKPGKIFIDLNGIGRQEFTPPQLPLTGQFALVSAIICYFGVHGLRINVGTEFPFQSGLGGSGSVSIALIGAILTALKHKTPQTREFPALAQIAHNLEDSLFGNTGMQDQAAALYGGANLWEWQYTNRLNFKRRELVSNFESLNQHILLAYTGRPHRESQNGSQMLNKFKENAALELFVSISDHARRFAELIGQQEYGAAGESLTAEFHLRSTLLPVLLPNDLELIELAEKERCGVSVTGRGGGGCIWAIGERSDIIELKKQWERAFESRKTGSLLPFNVTRDGLKVKIGCPDKDHPAPGDCQ